MSTGVRAWGSAPRLVALLAGLVALSPVGSVSGQSASPAAGTPSARVSLSLDGHIRDADLQHDSRDDRYRAPTGAVVAGTTVLLRVRTAAGDVGEVAVHLTDRRSTDTQTLPLAVVATDPAGGEHGYDYWQVAIETAAAPTVLDYWFSLRDGQSVRFLTDDPAADGGTGGIYRQAPTEGGWQISASAPGFTTPEWTRGAVVYQIFPDRFANGDPTNDPSPSATPGPTGAARYRYGDVYGNPVLVKAWTDLPEGYCRAYQGVTCAEQPLGRDFFGGDLAGITAHLDDLADLGVTALYLGPIFAAPSNHRYDTSDYLTIDPDLGTDADFDALMAGAGARGIRIILDGVFNHVSSDSPWFDRMGRYAEVGACESADSPFRDWFTFRVPAADEPSPCAPSTPGGTDTSYVGWAGFDTIPETNEVPAVQTLIAGPDGVVRHWLARGIGGWRLDVADNLSSDLLGRIRAAARTQDPGSLIIAEQWLDSSTFLLGDQADSTMDYRFRRAVIGLVNGPTADLDGAIAGLTPSGFAAAMLGVKEDYPAPAYYALLHMVDSHDTTRILWTLTPGAENEAAKSDPAARAIGLAKLRLVAVIQLTFPGMASIYYGDEVGLSGQDDPDDRRPFPWGTEDTSLRDVYGTLARLRADHVALRDGDLEFLAADDATSTLAFLRRTEAEAAITALDLGAKDWTLDLDVHDRLPDGTTLTDALSGLSVVVADGHLSLPLAAGRAAVLITAPGADLAPPATPTGLTATAGAGSVELAWASVVGAAGYGVERSILDGGGYTAVGAVSGPGWSDATVTAGTAYHYVVVALDAAGNVSARSADTVAHPQARLTDVRLSGPGELLTTLSAVDGGATVTGQVSVAEAPAGGVAGALRVQVGIGAQGSDPAIDPAWQWWPATGTAGTDGAALAASFTGHVLPESAGAFAVAARASADGGEHWTIGDRGGSADGYQPTDAVQLTVGPSDDQTAPPAPGVPEVVTSGADRVTLKWPAVEAPDLFRYLVLRADAGSTDFAILGSTGTPIFSDVSVRAGASYAYTVIAQDTAFNRSAPSPALEVAAAQRLTQVTFTVTVPADTPTTDTIYIAGDFQGWDPKATPMSKVDATTWSITLPFKDRASPQYKYTRGSWDAVEKDAGCGEIPNRQVVVDFGTSGEQAVADVIVKWRDIGHCG